MNMILVLDHEGKGLKNLFPHFLGYLKLLNTHYPFLDLFDCKIQLQDFLYLRTLIYL